MQPSPADKAALRHSLRQQRRAHAAVTRAVAAQVLVQAVVDLLQGCEIAPPAVIAGYHALADEIDPSHVLTHLRTLGYRTALPVTQGRDAGLLFYQCDDATPLHTSSFGVMEPQAGAVLTPDVLLVPLLGFDADCNRIGYGAGHYDRTLADLRDDSTVLAVGLAFDMQRVPGGLPVQEHDQPLDCVITDKGLYWPNTHSDMEG